MNGRIAAGTLLIGLSVTGCDRIPFLGGGSDDPADVARSFWEAARAGDMELAETFATGSESMSLNQPEGGDTGINSVQIGTATVDGERATVPTTLTNTLASEEPTDLAINTSLVQVEGEWKVDLDETMDAVMRGIMGVSATDLAQAMGDAMVGAMEGAMQGMTDTTTQETPPEDEPAPEATEPQAPQPAEQQAPQQTAPQQQVPATQTTAAEVPWTPIAGTVSPGMTPEQVVAAWGQPVTERQYGQWMYMFFRNGCENRCGTFDVVFFQNGQVVDAVVRTPAHTYTGVSSSPPDNVAGFTPPSATGGIGGTR